MFENWKNNNQRKNSEARAELNMALSKLREEEVKLGVTMQSYQKTLDEYAAFDPNWERHLLSTYELPLKKLEQDKDLKIKELQGTEVLLEAVSRLAKLQPSAITSLGEYQTQLAKLKNELQNIDAGITLLKSEWNEAKSKRQR